MNKLLIKEISDNFSGNRTEVGVGETGKGRRGGREREKRGGEKKQDNGPTGFEKGGRGGGRVRRRRRR